MGVAYLMRLVATILFVLAIFGVPWATPVELAAGLALWCGSTLAP